MYRPYSGRNILRCGLSCNNYQCGWGRKSPQSVIFGCRFLRNAPRCLPCQMSRLNAVIARLLPRRRFLRQSFLIVYRGGYCQNILKNQSAIYSRRARTFCNSVLNVFLACGGKTLSLYLLRSRRCHRLNTFAIRALIFGRIMRAVKRGR